MSHHKDNTTNYIPTSRRELQQRGWDEIDILFISGDAYIDHPAFGITLLARMLEAKGYRVGIIAQPDWRNPDSFKIMGQPRLFSAVSAGAMDSMVNHYTAAKKIRRNDAYTPGGKAGLRPNRAVVAYTGAVKSAFKGVPVIIGGIEASLRRLAHYDYWADKVRRSVLIDSKADMLLFGMAENALMTVAEELNSGRSIKELTDIRGSACVVSTAPPDAVRLPDFDAVVEDPDLYNRAYKLAANEINPFSGKVLVQAYGQRELVINPPALPLTQQQMDKLYALPFQRKPHPSYTERIPAYDQIKHSITSHRGCFGGCSFCAITHHQGKQIQSRSQQSVLAEVEQLVGQKDFHGTISDIGGPTANMYGLCCGNKEEEARCRRPSCIFPNICPNLKTDATQATQLMNKVRNHNKVKHSFISSGIRYDLLPRQQEYFDNLLQHHISGLLKVAPESTSDKVTRLMRKPGAATFTNFLDQFRKRSRELGLRQTVVPYLISSHPGCTLDDMIDVALYLKKHRLQVEQVQDFTPTPGSLSTCIYHTGRDPYSGKEIHIPRSPQEKRLQKALLLYHLPEAKKDILYALKLCNREDVAAQLFDNAPGRQTSESKQRERRGSNTRRDKRQQRHRR